MSRTTDQFMEIGSEALRGAIANRLVDECREVLRDLVLAPFVEIKHIDVEVFHSPRFDSETAKRCYLVTVSTNDASMLRGAVATYKGSYKERLEAVLDRVVKGADSQGAAYVNITGPEISTVDRLIPIQTFIQSGRLSNSAPIIKTAKANGIDYIQIRGRHLIAPSPAIAAFLEEYAHRNSKSIRWVVDLFAGTAIATKVLLRLAQPERVVAIDIDLEKVRKIREHVHDNRVEILHADALQFSFTRNYDLVIADPYYEDVPTFLSNQLENLRHSVQVLLLVPGNVEDHVWNDGVRQRLQGAQCEVITHELYGQVIFEVRFGRAPNA